jgi:hypothetical protein
VAQAATAYVSLEDYFESEVSAECEAPKHEWFDGVVYAMSRGAPEHARLRVGGEVDGFAEQHQVTLEEYVLVSQDERKIEVFRRSAGFRGDTATSGESFIVRGVALSVDDIYGYVIA